MIDASVQPPLAGEASNDNLAGWTNDDILLTVPTQKMVAEASPRAFRILDWAALRNEFESHDTLANRAKKRINHHGRTGALLSAIGSSLLAIAPLLPVKILQNIIVMAGCGFVLAGGVIGLWHFFVHRGRAQWLIHRLWTERLRQFYFQYLINNIDSAIGAMGDDAKLENYRSLRDGALENFVNYMKKSLSARSFVEGIRWLVDDHDSELAWGQCAWRKNRVLPGTLMTADHWELMECLLLRRIGIQDIYAQFNLKPGNHSQGDMAHCVITRGNIATFVFVASLTLAGMALLLISGQDSLPSDILIALSGVTAAWGLYFRLVDQGMGYSLDADRYELYAEQVRLVRQKFNAAGDNLYDKITALRQLEIYSYNEMRQFLRNHFRSKFLG